MTEHPLALSAARGLHTLIYGVMAVATVGLLYVGITGRFLPSLWVFVPLLSVEIVVFAASGLKCPLTGLVDRYAGAGVHMADTYLPETLTRHTLAIFGPILPVAFMLLAARWAGLITQGPGQ
ncbi:hypothetical protein [Brevundimonas variabilis]|uniref:DUF2784 domain-containing protein n=1 Tax=Brevundimonas variabilis TaxID=74312 RepID=A0A7W9CL55_9CAUL|nr:hypothetical protein [Brevundimonas variabilis]MBB5747556.1 hypothetical protein [Brevundimonas variabilis]